MKIVITGSSGQVGSYLVEHFSEGHEVIGIDRLPNAFPELSGDLKIADISKLRDLGEYLIDADWLLHAAAQVSVEKSLEDPLYDAENNVIGTLNLLWNSFKHDVKNFLYISSAAVYGNPIRVPIDEEHPTDPMSPYGVSKLCGEKYTRAFSEAYGLSTVVVRPFNIYSKRADPESPYSGVITRFISRAKQEKPLIIDGDGSQTRDFIHISDVVSMIDLITKNKSSIGKVFNCGTGKATSVTELAELVIERSSKKVDINNGPPRPGDIKHSSANIRRAEELLGYSAHKNLSEGIKEFFS